MLNLSARNLSIAIFKGRALDDDESNLGVLCSKQKTRGVGECVALRTDVDVAEEGEGLDVPVLVHRIVRHIHVSFTDCLSLDSAKVNGLLLGIVLHNFND